MDQLTTYYFITDTTQEHQQWFNELEKTKVVALTEPRRDSTGASKYPVSPSTPPPEDKHIRMSPEITPDKVKHKRRFEVVLIPLPVILDTDRSSNSDSMLPFKLSPKLPVSNSYHEDLNTGNIISDIAPLNSDKMNTSPRGNEVNGNNNHFQQGSGLNGGLPASRKKK